MELNEEGQLECEWCRAYGLDGREYLRFGIKQRQFICIRCETEQPVFPVYHVRGSKIRVAKDGGYYEGN